MNALPSQRWPEPPYENVLSDVIEQMTEEQQCNVLLAVSDKFSGDDHRQALADLIDTLSDAHYMLNLLFEHDITILQAREMTKHNTSCIVSLRTLRNLTEQCSRAVDDEMTDKAREIANV
jgi:hypothetical protein